MTVELASAYVSIVPSAKGIEGNLAKELSPLQGVASKAGADSGKALGKSFTGASGGLKSAVTDAGSSITKFKTGTISALDSVGVSSSLLKVAGGAALAGFAVHAVGAFTDVAKSAIDLSTSTGLGIEEASRWIGVADDYQVSAEALATGLGKVSKTLDDTKWAKYGIDTRDASGEARSANDILLDSFDKLSSITNATEQARVGQELFGKGYQSLTPILGHTRDEYEKMLGSVEKGQVITEAEAKKAERMRLAQDQLSDAVKEVTLSLGGLLSGLAPVIELLAKGVTIIGNVVSGITGLIFGVDESTGSFKKFFTEVAKQATIKQVGDELNKMNKAADESHSFFDRLVGFGSRFDSVNETIKKMGKESPESVDSVVDSLRGLKAAADAGDPAAQKLVKDYELTDDHLNQLAKYSLPAATDALQQLNDEAAKAQTDDMNERLEYQASRVAGVTYEVEKESKAVADNERANKSMSDDVQRGLDEITDSWDRLTGAISDDKTWTTLQSDFIDLKTKFEEANKAMVDGTDDAKAKALDYRAAVDDQKLAVIDYGKTVLGLPESKLTNILALIDQGSLDAAQAALDNLTRNRNIQVQIETKGGSGVFKIVGGAAAAGGYHSGSTLVGEKGPEIVDLPKGSYVHTASDTRSLLRRSSTSSTWATTAAPSSMRPMVLQLTAGNKLLQEIYLSGKQLEASVS